MAGLVQQQECSYKLFLTQDVIHHEKKTSGA
jgi:hypothetical protein